MGTYIAVPHASYVHLHPRGQKRQRFAHHVVQIPLRQFVPHDVMNGMKIQHVTGRIRLLAFGQHIHIPVAHLLGFVQLHTAVLQHQSPQIMLGLFRSLFLASCSGQQLAGNLRAKKRAHFHAQIMLQHCYVKPSKMEQLHHPSIRHQLFQIRRLISLPKLHQPHPSGPITHLTHAQFVLRHLQSRGLSINGHHATGKHHTIGQVILHNLNNRGFHRLHAGVYIKHSAS